MDDKLDELQSYDLEKINTFNVSSVVNIDEVNNYLNKYSNLYNVLPEIITDSNFDMFENLLCINYQIGSNSRSASITKTGSIFRK